MPSFEYRARDNAGRLLTGRCDAENEHAALAWLGQRGYFPLELQAADAPAASTPSSARGARPRRARAVKTRDLAAFTRQLANLIGAGLPLMSALNLLGQQVTHPTLRAAIGDIGDQVRGGASLSEALERHPRLFSTLYANLVRAGEVSGALELVLNRLADFAEAQDELVVKVQTALVYPALIVAVGIVTVIVLLTLVIPKLATMFDDMGGTLPLPTLLLMRASEFTVRYGWLLLIAAGAGIQWLRRARRTPAGRLRADRALLRLPMIGELLQQVELARMSRSLSMLIGNGVPVLQSIEVVGRSSGNAILQHDLERVQQAVAGGSALAQALKQTEYVTAEVANMVAVGEESGSLTTVLDKIGTAYEKLADRTTRLFTTLLEPVLILIVGVVVGFMVVAMLLPIFQIGLLAG